MKFIAYYDLPLGKITLAGDEAGLCGLWFEGEKYYAHALAMGSTDGKFCARTLIESEKFCARDFTAQSVSKKSHATNLSTQGESGKFCANKQGTDLEEKNLAVFDQTKRWLDLFLADVSRVLRLL
ncbi:hypothetical protein [uncultured Campylobacter sp.]|uniref:hypothetical protein n=1 Tax=uncultured Campylobacter sp. TaxID=218934 RepID=UPI00263127A7|nr:hypothetical protein [uncultured Campylobacter sp.]